MNNPTDVSQVSATCASRSGDEAASRADQLIRRATTGTVLFLAGVAGVVSYGHMHLLAVRYGEEPWTAALLPLSVDGMIVAASLTLLWDSRRGRSGGILPWALLVVASGASLAANVAVAHPMVISRVIAAWPSFALIGAYEMLMRHGTLRPLPFRWQRQNGRLPLCRAAAAGIVPGTASERLGSGQSATGFLPVACRPARQSPRRSTAAPGGEDWSRTPGSTANTTQPYSQRPSAGSAPLAVAAGAERQIAGTVDALTYLALPAWRSQTGGDGFTVNSRDLVAQLRRVGMTA